MFLANRLPHSSLHFQVPYTLLFHKSPDYLSLKPFGCACFPWLKPYNSHKLLPRSETCIFLGYCTTSKAYRCYDPIKQKIYVSRHVKFEESCFPFQSLISSCSSTSSPQIASPSFPISLTSYNDLVVQISVPVPIPLHTYSSTPTPAPVHTSSVSNSSTSSSTLPPVVTASTHTPPVPDPLQSVHPMTTKSKAGIFKPKNPISLLTTIVSTEPRNFHEAVKSDVWKQAMVEEYQALLKQGTLAISSPSFSWPNYWVSMDLQSQETF